MELTYESKTFYLSDENKLMLDNTSSAHSPHIKKLEDECKTGSKVIYDYKELLKVIKEEIKEELEKLFFCWVQDGYFVIFKKTLIFETKIFASYKIESKEIEEMLKKIFYVDSFCRCFLMDNENYYNFFVPFSVLELFFVEADIRSRGEKPYRTFKIKKKSGKLRQIVAPHEEIKTILRDINKIFQNTYDKRNSDFQVAYKKGKNISDNAKIHKSKRFFMTADLKDFFTSCKKNLVKKYIKFLFAGIEDQNKVQDYFLDIILWEDALFIGSPISGTIANAILSPAVKYMKNICKNFNMEFSIYADDMTFSSDSFLTKEFVSNIFNLAFSTYKIDDYFFLNESKFQGYSGSKRRTVGLSINPNNKITIPNRKYREMRTRIHNLHYKKGGQGGNLKELKGIIAFASAYDENGKIYRLLKKYEPTVKKYKLCSEKVMKKMEEALNV